MVGHDLQPLGGIELSGKSTQCAQTLLLVVEPGNQRQADQHPGAGGAQLAHVVQNLAVVRAGQLAVALRVHVLDIAHPVVDQRQKALQAGPGGQRGGFDGSGHLALTAQFEDGGRKFGLVERLPAGQGDPALGVVVKWLVAQHHVDHLPGGLGLANGLQGAGVAGLHADAALLALLGVAQVFALGQKLVGLVLAGLQAGAATYAAGRVVGHLPVAFQTFGVVAPLAAQGTAFDEDRGANARAVVGAEALDVEDSAGDGTTLLFRGGSRAGRGHGASLSCPKRCGRRPTAENPSTACGNRPRSR